MAESLSPIERRMRGVPATPDQSARTLALSGSIFSRTGLTLIEATAKQTLIEATAKQTLIEATAKQTLIEATAKQNKEQLSKHTSAANATHIQIVTSLHDESCESQVRCREGCREAGRNGQGKLSFKIDEETSPRALCECVTSVHLSQLTHDQSNGKVCRSKQPSSPPRAIQQKKKMQLQLTE